MKHRLLLLTALLATIGGCRSGGKSESDEAPPPVVEVSVAPAIRGEIRYSVSATGEVAPLPNEEVKVAPLTAGRIAKVFVSMGDRVRKGQTIATLDPGAATGQLQQAAAAVRSAQAALQQARINLANQATTYAQDLRQAELNVEAQRVALQKLRSGSRPQEIAQARSAVASAQAALTNAQQNLTRSRTLFDQGLLARKDLEAAQASEATARAALAGAQQALSMTQQGNRPEDIRAGEVALAQAEQQLSTAKSQSIQRRLRQQDVLAAQGQVQAAQGSFSAALANARSLSIVTPVAGLVTGRTVNPGESVDASTTIATIVNLTRARLLLNVPPDQVGRVRVGDPVTFTTDGDPGTKMAARVSVVNQATDTNSNTVSVEATAGNKGGTLRDDEFVKATITTATHRNAVLVPAGSVVEKDGKTYVFVAGRDGVAHQKEIKVGAREGTVVEALAGVSAGDVVVTTGAYELDDGTKIKVAQ